MDTTLLIQLAPVFLVLFVALWGINKVITLELVPVKYPEIDGLRGYLAFFVFLHHSYIWHQYLRTKIWEDPKSALFTHFGQTSVVLFFIITAFLFLTKLLEHKSDFDWSAYLKARFFRLFPMYFCVVLFIFAMVGYYSDFKQLDSVLGLLKSSLSWLFFTVDGAQDINGFHSTFLMNSGVSWTLPYEWMFYFLLPVFALLLRKKVPYKTTLVFTLVFLLILWINQASLRHFMPFIGGIVAAVMLQKMNLRPILERPVYSFIALALLVVSILCFDSGRKPVPIICSSLFFIIIASGNSLFGVLTREFSRKFGQITYSLYLVHGTLLFVLFYGVLGLERASQLSETEYWGLIALTVIPLLLISQLTFKYIELPMMQFLKNKKR
jgi:peptidoglycan/LPS O-acetylase OafA/YrhL